MSYICCLDLVRYPTLLRTYVLFLRDSSDNFSIPQRTIAKASTDPLWDVKAPTSTKIHTNARIIFLSPIYSPLSCTAKGQSVRGLMVSNSWLPLALIAPDVLFRSFLACCLITTSLFDPYHTTFDQLPELPLAISFPNRLEVSECQTTIEPSLWLILSLWVLETSENTLWKPAAMLLYSFMCITPVCAPLLEGALDKQHL